MKKIRQKISIPIITVIIITSVITIIFFNISIKIYISKETQDELRNSVDNIQVLSNKLFPDRTGNELDDRNIPTEKLQKLRNALKVANLSLNTEILLVSKKQKIIFPQNFDNTFLTDEIVSKSLAELSKEKENSIIEFGINGNMYLTTYKPLTQNSKFVQMLFISSENSTKSLIRIINHSLLIILIISTGIGIIIVEVISKKISRPLINLSYYARKIGSGEFITLEEDNSSVEINELTHSMNDMSIQLKNYDNAQKSFLQNASHELRTPLMSIQGYAEGISKGVFLDAQKQADIIVQESKRLNNLVEELLTLSRIDNNSYKKEVEVLNLSDLMKECIARINGYATKENKELKLCNECENILVRIDENLFIRAVINIISNCIKYAKSQINICILKKDKNAIIKIEDDGNGFSQYDLLHIFERFYKGKQGNFGLGLSIAKACIEYMNGDIIAYNDNGAVFEISLPIEIT